MMDLFPFDLIERGSTILLYGLGKCGRTYIEQNGQLKWCEIKYVSDKAEPVNEFRHLYIKPEDISKVIEKVDKIVIAISNPKIVEQVQEWLTKRGIDAGKIIGPSLSKESIPVGFRSRDLKQREKIRILLVMIGGLGDYIVYLSFYQRLLEYMPDAEIVIQGETVLLDAIYGQKENAVITSSDLKIETLNEFDCILELGHFIKVVWHEPTSLPEEFTRKLTVYEAEYERRYSIQDMRDALFIQRMMIARRNRYDALGGGPIFKLGRVKLRIEFSEQAKHIYAGYNFKQYVTFNYGSAKIREATEEQMKVWPKEYYKEWICRFKKKYPNLEVIQIGVKDAVKIEGADRYILGGSLEVVKYILKNALFHLDCEGGLVHLATAVDTKCIVLFGPTPLEYYAYPQNVN